MMMLLVEAVGVAITGYASTWAWRLLRAAVKSLAIRLARNGETAMRLRVRRRLIGASTSKIADLAAILAGRRRPGLREEWRAHLAGEAGHELSVWRKVGAALGFLVAAARYRLQDATDLAWVLADAILKSRVLSNLVMWTPTAAAIVILFDQGGIDEVLADAESIVAIGGALYGSIRICRWWRGVKPQDPKVRNVNE
jgi:hypothetical protein